MKNIFKITLLLILTSSISYSFNQEGMTWEPDVNARNKQINGKIGDETVVIASAEDEDGIRSLQMVLVAGIPSATITTRKSKKPGEFLHSVTFEKGFKYSTQIDASDDDSVVVTLLDNGKIVRRFHWNMKSELVILDV